MLGLLAVKSHVYAYCLSGENLFQKNINVEKFAKTTPSPIFETEKNQKILLLGLRDDIYTTNTRRLYLGVEGISSHRDDL